MFNFTDRKYNAIATMLCLVLLAVVFGFAVGTVYSRIDLSELVELPKP